MSAVKNTAPLIGIKRHRFSVDGKGVTTLVGFHGCTLSCKYCLNPQCLRTNGILYIITPNELLKEVTKDNLYFLATGGGVTFGGGEPTILQEFEELINLLLDYDVYNIRIHSDGIKYSPGIERGLRLGKITLITSVDSSSAPVYEKIKQVPCYDKVWKNLKKYADAKNGLIRTKYVLIPGINDNLTEIKNWLQKTYEVGIKNIAFDIEDNWFKENREDIPQYIYVIFDFVYECYKQYKIESCELYERAYNLKADRENKQKSLADK